MPRLTALDDVLFPVEEHQVFARVHDLPEAWDVPVPGKKAIVNRATGQVLGIVGRDYRLVTNNEALRWAHECCRAAFPQTSKSEWQVTATDAPGTGAHCFIDLTHNSGALDFGLVEPQRRPDVFGPFLRVTNSYNGQRALAFDIGFKRKVCSNGLILSKTVIRFSFAHSRRALNREIRFEIVSDRLATMQEDFERFVGVLRRRLIEQEQMFSLVAGALGLKEPGADILARDPRAAANWAALRGHTDALIRRYSEELGRNAYAVLNAITDFASRPPVNQFVQRDRHSLQRLAGEWMASFASVCARSDVDSDSYSPPRADRIREHGCLLAHA